MRLRLREYLLFLAAFGVVSAAYLAPLVRGFAGAIGPDLGDPLFNLYILKWDVHSLAHGIAGLWSPPFFFPTAHVLALSDHLLGLTPPFAAFRVLGAGDLAAFNLLYLAAFAVTGANAAWVLRRGGRSLAAAWLGAMAYAFCSFRWAEISHLQVLWTLWIPPLLWTWDQFLRDLRPRRAVAFIVLYVLHVLGGCYLAYMAHVPLAVIALLRRRELRAQLSDGRKRGLAAVVVVACVALTSAILLPYWQVGRSLHLERTAHDYQRFGATLVSLVTPAFQNWYRPDSLVGWTRQENSLLFGFVPLALAIGALVHRGDRPPRHVPRLGVRRWGLLAVFTLVAAFGFALGEWASWRDARFFPLGPLSISLAGYRVPLFILLLGAGGLLWTLHGAARSRTAPRTPCSWERVLIVASAVCGVLMFPIVFAPLAQIVPGLGGMRVPARFFAFASLGLAVLAARGLDLLRGLRPRALANALVALACVATLAELWPTRLHWEPLPPAAHASAADLWLAQADGVRGIADLPLAKRGTEIVEILAMIRGTAHWKPLVNGYSGYLAPTYVALRETMPRLPEDDDLDALRALGVTHLVVRGAPFEDSRRFRAKLSNWRARVGRPDGPGLETVFEDPESGDGVYRVLAKAPPASGAAAPWRSPANLGDPPEVSRRLALQ